MKDKADRIQDELERAYRILRYAEQTGTEAEVAYLNGYIAGMKKVIDLVINCQ